MGERAAAARAACAALPDDRARIATGVELLGELYRDCIRAAAPPNVAFERERIIAQAVQPREWAYVLGFLSEGENEAGLLLELMDGAGAADPQAEVGHLIDEAWYYLRTSIDETWQLDDGPPSVTAALVYLILVLEERLEVVASGPAPAAPAGANAASRAALLRGLRAEFALTPNPLPAPAR